MTLGDGTIAYLTLDGGPLADPVQLRTQTSNLQRNLNSSSSIKANSIVEQVPESDVEKKGDFTTLYTIGLSFIQAGAAKVLIDALKAAFAASHNNKLRATLKLNNAEIEITSESLSAEQLQNLVEKINQEIKAA